MDYYNDKVQKSLPDLKNCANNNTGNFDAILRVGIELQGSISGLMEYVVSREESHYNFSEIIDMVAEEITNEDEFVRNHVVFGIVRIGKPAIEPMIESLKDKRKFVKRCAADILNAITHKKLFWGNDS